MLWLTNWFVLITHCQCQLVFAETRWRWCLLIRLMVVELPCCCCCFSLEKNSCWHFFFGKKFLLTFFLWETIPVDNFVLEKSSCWKVFFGKKFLLKTLLWKKVPAEIITLEKSSCWNFQFPFSIHKKLIYMIAVLKHQNWKYIPNFNHCLGKSSSFQKNIGKKFLF